MSKKDKRNPLFSPDNKQTSLTDKASKIIEGDLLHKEQELKGLEESLTQKETAIAIREEELKTAKEAICAQEAQLNNKRVQLEDLELQAKNNFPKLFEEKFADFKIQLEKREAQYSSELTVLEAEKEKLRQRERTIQKAEIQRDSGYSDDRAKLDEELFKLRLKHEKELESKRTKALAAIEKELSEERNSRLLSLNNEIADILKSHKASLQKEEDELDEKRKVLLKDQAKLDELKDELEYQKQRLQSRRDALDEREINLSVELDNKVAERKQSLEQEKSALNDEISRLRESVKSSVTLISNFEELKNKLGDEDPVAVLLKLKTYEEEIKKLRDDLATRPTLEMQQAFDRLKSETGDLQSACERLSEENGNLRSTARIQSDLEVQIAELSDKNKSLLRRFESVDAENTRLHDELQRYASGYQKEEEVEKRIKRIKKPLDAIPIKERESSESIDEIKWLDGIQSKFELIGFSFPNRILKAFHTSLKTAEWSPLTVLAGVSGTGKSKLPELYAQFGGLNFLNTPVQPNWDSMESMLGFYNSIDNYFDAQPVLRFLAQSQLPPTEDYPNGLSDVMNLVLLDEMNLAHIELYFADFLSKLEERRGRKIVPSIPVKIGAKEDPYMIPMGRNVLWVGTMNQDETTKSLSDKVIDRGVVINFPRPERLERMKKLSDPSSHSAKLITKKQWGRWWADKSIFNDEQISPYKLFVEEMNTSLSKVGRALGHRVWQSIEYYMSNYPDVLEAQRNNDDAGLAKAMKVAFEDQLVQKVMPKLRGIETRGKSKSDCLDKIRTQLVNDDYTIIDDFDLACEFGYGQFIWNSANYLKEAEFESNLKNVQEEKSNFTKSVDVYSEGIPSLLIQYAEGQAKKLWELSTSEIKSEMNCNAKEAQRLKTLCNKTKES